MIPGLGRRIAVSPGDDTASAGAGGANFIGAAVGPDMGSQKDRMQGVTILL
jgi:hypothetical protein